MLFGIAGLIALVLPPQPIAISIHARSLQPGELVVVEMAMTEMPDHVRVRAFDHDIPAYATGDHKWRALVGIDLDVKPGTHVVQVDAGTSAGEAHATYELAVKPKAFPTRRLTVDGSFVTPPAAVKDRIDQEEKLLKGVWEASPDTRLWKAAFVRPVPHPANSAFGTRSIFNGMPRGSHAGADFMSPAGAEVRAPNAGRIVVARPLYFAGNSVVIDHGLGLFSLLAHLSAFEVHEGDMVTAGQVVGRVGATGRVTGAHLHWALRASGARVDPLALLALLGH
jgi:Peptidase family M23